MLQGTNWTLVCISCCCRKSFLPWEVSRFGFDLLEHKLFSSNLMVHVRTGWYEYLQFVVSSYWWRHRTGWPMDSVMVCLVVCFVSFSKCVLWSHRFEELECAADVNVIYSLLVFLYVSFSSSSSPYCIYVRDLGRKFLGFLLPTSLLGFYNENINFLHEILQVSHSSLNHQTRQFNRWKVSSVGTIGKITGYC